MRCLPRSYEASATPLIAKLLASVAPLVKTISSPLEPIASAIVFLACFTAASASQP